jgi:serine/threonine protein phosphatase PrpC
MHSKVFPLSYDCKPELPNERKRILARGGIVERAYDPYYGETGPYRVWGRGEDAPGLAMSRSIGDMDAKRFGVIPNPQIVEYTIDYFTKYLIMASDGIWEFISNEQAMKLSNKYYLRNDCSGICHELTQRAISLWEKNDYVIDDITVLVVLF